MQKYARTALTAIFRLVSHRYSTTQWLSLTDCVAYSSGNRCKILKGTVADLPTTNRLVEECNQVMPAIAETFGLG